MKKKFIIAVLGLFLLACEHRNVEAQQNYLSGYWEIKSVQLPDGSEKEFGYNSSIDFIELIDTLGIRKKLVPSLNGSFISAAPSEQFIAKIEKDSLRLYYKTAFDSWKETVVFVDDSLMIIKNQQQKTYTYKRYVALNPEYQ